MTKNTKLSSIYRRMDLNILKWRLSFVLFILAVTLTNPVSALAGVTVESLEDVLRGQGYDVELHPGLGSHGRLDVRREAVEYSIYPIECADQAGDKVCGGYFFQQILEASGFTQDQINDWNVDAVFGRAYFRDGTSTLEFAIFVGNIVPGQRFLTETLEQWRETVESFQPDADAEVEPEPGADVENETDDFDRRFHQKIYSSAIHCPFVVDDEYFSPTNLTLGGDREVITGQYLYDEGDSIIWSVKAGGNHAIKDCNYLPDPSGFIDSDLLILVEIDMDGDYDLEVQTIADCDTVLLVLDPDGRWFFDDDSGDDTQEELRIPGAPSGEYEIWVGTLDGDYCDAKVKLETF